MHHGAGGVKPTSAMTIPLASIDGGTMLNNIPCTPHYVYQGVIDVGVVNKFVNDCCVTTARQKAERCGPYQVRTVDLLFVNLRPEL
jgi:hypothetical protein